MAVHWSHVLDLVKESCPLLHEEFKKKSQDDYQLNVYWKTVHGHIAELFKEMLEEARRDNQETADLIMCLMKKITDTSKELHMKVDVSQYSSNCSLKIARDQLQRRLKALELIKEERIHRLQKLQEKETRVCSKLGISPSNVSKAIPSDDELEEYRSLVERHEIEKDRLEQKFEETREAILRMMSDLDISPSLEFERQVCEQPQTFIYTSENMAHLQELLGHLTSRVRDVQPEVLARRAELRNLWKFLGEPAEACEAFLARHPGSGLQALKAIKAQIKRCKVKRSERIEVEVDQLRQEIAQLWEMCKIGTEERQQFAAFSCNVFNEDLLALHELEVQKLRNFRSENRHIFDLLEERNVLLEKIMELQTRANNKDRLHNRGGQLLAEEKERKRISKKLPKTEDKLKALARKFEEERGYTFKVNGLALDDFLLESWNQLEQQVEMSKKARKNAKDKSTLRMTPVTPSKKAGSSFRSMRKVTPASAGTARSLFLGTTALEPDKRRDASADKRTPTSRRVTTKKTRKGTLVVSRRSLPRTAEVDNQKPRRSRSDSRAVDKIPDSSYDEFQNHLENRYELRSSALHSQVLRQARSKITTTTATATVTTCRSPGRTPRSSRIAANSTLVPVLEGSFLV